MRYIKVRLNERSYKILIGKMGFSKLVENIERLHIGSDAFVITNPTVYKLHGERLRNEFHKKNFKVRVEFVEDKETAKSWTVTFRLLEQIAKFDKLKKIFIIALGGGVVGDLSGFVASVYKRGVPYIQVPTTLLSQVDSAIGGKVAIDLSIAKNIVGSFYQPRLVFSELTFLKTLPLREIIAGLSEVIKYAMVKDKDLFEFIEKNYKNILKKDTKALEYIIYTSSAIKASLVEQDEFDRKGIRIILNFGHTIGHAIETSTDYSGIYNHGEAIAIGMVCACIISEKLGLLDHIICSRLERLLLNIGLPVRLKKINLSCLLAAYKHDKKFIHGYNRLVLPVEVGKTIIKEDISQKIISDTLKEVIKN